MTLTFIGIIQLVIGAVLLVHGSLRAMFGFLMLSGLFGGSAAVIVGALGNSSVPPIQFALLFMTLRLLMPLGGYFHVVAEGIRANLPLVLFTLYGVAAAFIAPRVFAGAINVAPMRFENARSLFDSVPLEPTQQNITAAVYLVGFLLVTLSAYVTCRVSGGVETLVRSSVLITWIHAISGIVAALTDGTAVEQVFDLFRNGNYGQLDQTYRGFVRIDGFFPEASAYAAFGFGLFAFCSECWYRGILTRSTGRAALAMLAVLFFSTSATAYVGLGCYAAFFVLRVLAAPTMADPSRVRAVLVVIGGGMVVVALAMALLPAFAGQVTEMIWGMTFGKTDSNSAQQRMSWALQGIDAFVVSAGLGIGPGSFRSSSFVLAIIGSMGLVGIGTMLTYIIMVMAPPVRRSPSCAAQEAVRSAAVWSAMVVLVPAAISSPNVLPGTSFAIFCGAALAIRRNIAVLCAGEAPTGAIDEDQGFVLTSRGGKTHRQGARDNPPEPRLA